MRSPLRGLSRFDLLVDVLMLALVLYNVAAFWLSRNYWDLAGAVCIAILGVWLFSRQRVMVRQREWVEQYQRTMWYLQGQYGIKGDENE